MPIPSHNFSSDAFRSARDQRSRTAARRPEPVDPIYLGNRDLQTAVAREGDIGNTASNEFLNRARNFDPMASIRDYTTGAFNQFRGQLNEDIGTLRGQQVGMGRLNTGFATRDEDRLVRDSTDRLNNSILQQSVRGAEMDQENTRSIGDFGSGARNTYLDALSGLTTSREQQKLEDKASKRDMWGNIIGGVTSAIGAAIPFISDERAKEDVRPMDGALDKIDGMNGYEYEYTPEAQGLGAPPGRTGGVMAQDVAEIAPEAVGEMPGGFAGVDYTQVVGMLTEAVKELEDRLEALEPKKAEKPAKKEKKPPRAEDK